MKKTLFWAGFATLFVALSVPANARIKKSPIKVDEGPCIAVMEFTDGPNKGKFANSAPGSIQVIRDTEKGLLKINPGENLRVNSIVCTRSTPVPHPNDYRVILSGFDLMIFSMNDDRKFSTVLTKRDGKYVLDVNEGKLTKKEQAYSESLLRHFKKAEEFYLEAQKRAAKKKQKEQEKAKAE